MTTLPQIIAHTRTYLLASMPPMMRQSLPLPRRHADGLRLRFLYHRAEHVGPDDGQQLWAPQFIATIDVATQRTIRVEAVTPRCFQLDDPIDRPIGPCRAPSEMLDDAYVQSFAEYLRLADAVFPLFAASQVLSDEHFGIVQEFVVAWEQVQEPELARYERTLGASFLEWMKPALAMATA